MSRFPIWSGSFFLSPGAFSLVFFGFSGFAAASDLSASLSFGSSPAKAPAGKKLSAARTATGAWNRRIMRETPVATLYAQSEARVALPVKRGAPLPVFCFLIAALIQSEADHSPTLVDQDVYAAVDVGMKDSPFVRLGGPHIA